MRFFGGKIYEEEISVFIFSPMNRILNGIAHSSLAGGCGLSEGDSVFFSLPLMDFRKFFIPSPKDFPSSGSLREPNIMIMIKAMSRSSIGPTGPNKNIKASS